MNLTTINIIIVLCPLLSSATDWNYDNQEDWGGMCKEGKQQSPVDININLLDKPGNGGPFFELANLEKDARFIVCYIDHTIHLIPPKGTFKLIGGPLTKAYTLHAIVFKHESEHTLGEQRLPGEMQYFFYSGPENQTDLVASSWVTSNNAITNSAGLTDFIDAASNLKSSKDLRIIQMDLLELIGERFNRVFMYQGSLTRPDCKEGVIWIIAEKYLLLQPSLLHKLIYAPYANKTDRFRKVQPLNDRKVVFVAMTGTRLSISSIRLLMLFMFVVQNTISI